MKGALRCGNIVMSFGFYSHKTKNRLLFSYVRSLGIYLKIKESLSPLSRQTPSVFHFVANWVCWVASFLCRCNLNATFGFVSWFQFHCKSLIKLSKKSWISFFYTVNVSLTILNLHMQKTAYFSNFRWFL